MSKRVNTAVVVVVVTVVIAAPTTAAPGQPEQSARSMPPVQTAPPAIDFDSGNLLGLSLSPPCDSPDASLEPTEPWGDRPWGNPNDPPLVPEPFAPRHDLGPLVDWQEPPHHPPPVVLAPAVVLAGPATGQSYMHAPTPSTHRPPSTAHASASGPGSV